MTLFSLFKRVAHAALFLSWVAIISPVRAETYFEWPPRVKKACNGDPAGDVLSKDLSQNRNVEEVNSIDGGRLAEALKKYFSTYRLNDRRGFLELSGDSKGSKDYENEKATFLSNQSLFQFIDGQPITVFGSDVDSEQLGVDSAVVLKLAGKKSCIETSWLTNWSQNDRGKWVFRPIRIKSNERRSFEKQKGIVPSSRPPSSNANLPQFLFDMTAVNDIAKQVESIEKKAAEVSRKAYPGPAEICVDVAQIIVELLELKDALQYEVMTSVFPANWSPDLLAKIGEAREISSSLLVQAALVDGVIENLLEVCPAEKVLRGSNAAQLKNLIDHPKGYNSFPVIIWNIRQYLSRIEGVGNNRK